MFLFLTVLQAIIAAALVGVILMQRSEGGGLGIGGGGSPGGMMSARGAADFLTRATRWLAVVFVVLSIILASLAVNMTGTDSIESTLDRNVTPAAPADPLDDPDLAVVERDLAQRIGGTVGAVVVDEDRFPAQFRQFRVELFDQRDDIVALVERGQDDRDFKHSGVTPNGRKVRQSAPAAPAADRARP